MDIKKTIVLGITGGIAAFKAVELVKKLRSKGFAVIVIMTKSAAQMVSPQEFEKASGNKVYSQLFEKDFDYKALLKKRGVEHIQIADRAFLFIIIPATANIIAKIAHGIADDFLTTALLATKAPVLICPSMNVNMWKNPIVQENISKVKQLEYLVIDPDSGMLACGYEGKGRLADIERIEQEIERTIDKTETLKGRKIIITAGGTIEPIDDIRFITNRSSGKMGVALAEACQKRGADVLLLRAKNSVSPRYPMKEEVFETADELAGLLKKYSSRYAICFHTAAVSDFSIVGKQTGKMSSARQVSLTLVPREKILKLLKEYNPSLRIIAFKAEWNVSDQKLRTIAAKKIKQFNLEAVIANDVSKKNQGFEVDNNEVLVVTKQGEAKKFLLSTKRQIATEVVEYLTEKLLL